MTAVLIDDEKNNIDNLRELLHAYCPQVVISGTASSADEGRNHILKSQPDLIFLDIQMPEKNGFDMLKELDAYNFEVIFVTAHDQYAIQAMRFAAVDYLLKPINVNELQLAVGRASKKQLLKEQNRQLENLIHLLKSQQTKDEQRLALTTLKETRFVKTGDIIRCESSNNYTTFYLQDGEQLLVCRPIYEFEEILNDYGFIRCHQSHLINRSFIKSWKKEYGDFLLLTNGDEVPISRNKKEMVKKELN
jgi:two-component system, LytTR family, response regulator